MTESTYETVDALLAGVQAEVDDSDLVFKLRTARQLIVLLREREGVGREALDEVEIDTETRERLRRLGYLE